MPFGNINRLRAGGRASGWRGAPHRRDMHHHCGTWHGADIARNNHHLFHRSSCRPDIDPNYYATEADRQTLRYGIRQALRLLQETDSGAGIVENELPPAGYPILSASSTDAEIDAR